MSNDDKVLRCAVVNHFLNAQLYFCNVVSFPVCTSKLFSCRSTSWSTSDKVAIIHSNKLS